MKLQSRTYFKAYNKNVWGGGMMLARYIRRDNNGGGVSGTFRDEQQAMTREALEAIYSAGTPSQLNAIINRSISRTDGKTREGEIQLFPALEWKIPGTPDRLSQEIGFKYNSKKEESWRDQAINYGDNPQPSYNQRRYNELSPNHTLTLISNTTYTMTLRPSMTLSFNYEYRFLDRTRDSYEYELDRLADMSIFGVLPAGWLGTLDGANSYSSRLMENTHTLNVRFYYSKILSNLRMFVVNLNPDVAIKHSRLDYRREGIQHFVKENYFLTSVPKMGGRVDLRTSAIQNGNGKSLLYKHIYRWNFYITPSPGNLYDMVDVVNDSNPLNITYGNPDLKTQYTYGTSFEWRFAPGRHVHPLNNTLSVSADLVRNSIVRGYTYDTTTGVRHTQSYNVNGNRSFGFSDSFMLQFGDKDRFAVSSNTSLSLTRDADMVGINATMPTKYVVDGRYITESLQFSWDIGMQTLRLVGKITDRHSTSDREDFNNISARHYTGSLIGNFRLPGGFGIATDYSLYKRSGYGVRELDTTDAVWNMRLSWTPPMYKSLSIMVDGFDLLHRLFNVNYAVGATGRTVSYTNALPRYVLFTLQYKMNIQPKK